MKSQMVWAQKYRLLTPESIVNGTYREDGQKEMVHDWKLVPRDWVEGRNAQRNNELYIVDEEETERLMKIREENIKKQAEDRKKEQVSMADLVGAIAEGVAPKKKAKKSKDVEDAVEVDDELEEVRAQWSELHDGKKPHHAKKLAKLKAEIQAKLDEQDSE